MGIEKYMHMCEKYCRDCNRDFKKRYEKCTNTVNKYEYVFLEKIKVAILECGNVPRYAIFNNSFRGINNNIKIIADKDKLLTSIFVLKTCYVNLKKPNENMIRDMIGEIESKFRCKPHYCLEKEWKPYNDI